jgi:hypothetical protein
VAERWDVACLVAARAEVMDVAAVG